MPLRPKVIRSRNPYECTRVAAEGLLNFEVVPQEVSLIPEEKETHTTPCSAEGPERISSMNHALCSATPENRKIENRNASSARIPPRMGLRSIFLRISPGRSAERVTQAQPGAKLTKATKT